MARGAVLGGHAAAHMVRGLIPIFLMSICGLVIGWRIDSSVQDAVAGYALMIAFSFAVIWLGILLGAAMPTPEAVQGVGFARRLPAHLRRQHLRARQHPARRAADDRGVEPREHAGGGAADLFGNPRAPRTGDQPWSLQHPVAYTLIWIVGLIVDLRAARRATPTTAGRASAWPAPLSICVSGALGGVGRRLVEGIHADPAFTLHSAIARREVGRDVGEALGGAPIGVVDHRRPRGRARRRSPTC